MSRIGKQPVPLPAGVMVTVDGQTVKVKGTRGELSLELHPSVRLAIGEKELLVSVMDAMDNDQRALWGLFRNLLNNMIIGVTKGFEKKLELVGVGYKVAVSGSKLVLNVGFSHPVEITLPEGIVGTVEKNVLTIAGIDKQLVGETSARIRRVRKPEPYKGKGIKYIDEVIRRKAGKAAKASE